MSESFNELTELDVLEVSSVDAPANLRKFALFKKRDHQPDSMEESVEEENKTPEVEAVDKAVEEVEQVEERTEEVEALAKAQEEKEAVEKELAAVAKELAEARAILMKQQDEKITAEYVAKARDEFSAVSDDSEDLGDLLKKLNAADEDLAKRVEDLLAKCEENLSAKDAAIEGGELLAEVGQAGEPEEVSAYDQIKKEASKLREIDPSLSDAQARAKVLEMKPDLYDLYKKEGK